MAKAILGKVHGRTITLDEDPGIADGQEVNVVVTVVRPQQQWGEGIKRSAGAAATTADFDAIFEQIQEERIATRFRESGE